MGSVSPEVMSVATRSKNETRKGLFLMSHGCIPCRRPSQPPIEEVKVRRVRRSRAGNVRCEGSSPRGLALFFRLGVGDHSTPDRILDPRPSRQRRQSAWSRRRDGGRECLGIKGMVRLLVFSNTIQPYLSLDILLSNDLSSLIYSFVHPPERLDEVLRHPFGRFGQWPLLQCRYALILSLPSESGGSFTFG